MGDSMLFWRVLRSVYEMWNVYYLIIFHVPIGYIGISYLILDG